MKRVVYLGNEIDARCTLVKAELELSDLEIFSLDGVKAMPSEGMYGELVIDSEGLDARYELPEHESRAILHLARPGFCELIIVPNNVGIGLRRASYIDHDMKSNTAIVWNNYELGNETEYANMGFSQFFSREDVWRYVVTKFR